ncbi:MAG: hypothetical protein OEM67_13370 [Thermoleophilia bacterium]|nr:hypothetical protein [Thermoleophilia bacterium]
MAAKLWTEPQRVMATATRDALAAAAEVAELVEVGAYVPGSNPRADRGLRAAPRLVEFLKQSPDESAPMEQSWDRLAGILQEVAA